MRYVILLWAVCLALPSFAQTPSGKEILQMIDKNFRGKNRISVSRMTIHGRRGSRTVQSKSWIRGTQKAFTEYLAPAREKGTKMLKLGDQLWTYTPSTDRTIKISGHMLRQSVMGSDLSYEDFLEDQKLYDIYNAEIVGEESFLERTCWILQLTAIDTDVTYYSRKIWVDKSRYLPLREERYAKSGKLLKTTAAKEVAQSKQRWYIKHAVFKDELKGSGKGTEFLIDSVEFDADIPDHIFSKAVLRK
jgi:outer membrane lipoprotein-sorting protein